MLKVLIIFKIIYTNGLIKKFFRTRNTYIWFVFLTNCFLAFSTNSFWFFVFSSMTIGIKLRPEISTRTCRVFLFFNSSIFLIFFSKCIVVNCVRYKRRGLNKSRSMILRNDLLSSIIFVLDFYIIWELTPPTFKSAKNTVSGHLQLTREIEYSDLMWSSTFPPPPFCMIIKKQ